MKNSVEGRSSDLRFPRRKKLPHEIPWWVAADSAWFVTINCDPPGKSQLCAKGNSNGAAISILDAARFYHEMDEPRWFIYCFLLMPDHLHAILSFPRDVPMRQIVAAWKGYVKRKHGIAWQSDFFDHRLRNLDEQIQKMEYIRMNPVRKGLCERPDDWPHVLSFDPRTGEEVSEWNSHAPRGPQPG